MIRKLHLAFPTGILVWLSGCLPLASSTNLSPDSSQPERSAEASSQDLPVDCPIEGGTVMVSTQVSVPPAPRNVDDFMAGLSEHYPPQFRDAGIGGTAQVRLLIDRAGRVAEATIIRSSGYPEMDSAAVRVARDTRFAPARQGTDPVCITLGIPLTFSPEMPAAPARRVSEQEPLTPGDQLAGELRWWANREPVELSRCTTIVVGDSNCPVSAALAASWDPAQHPEVLWLMAGDSAGITRFLQRYPVLESASFVAMLDGSIASVADLRILATPTVLALDPDRTVRFMRLTGSVPGNACAIPR